MSYEVRVYGTDIAFACAPGQSLLEAAEAAGYEFPYSCRRGICQSCHGRVVSGEVEAPPMDAEEVLFCQAKARSNLEIQPRKVLRIDPAARKTVDARVLRVTWPARDVAAIQLRFPAGTRVKFRAGQYLEVILGDGARRSFSMANPPQQSDGALLHVRVLPGGRFAEEVLPVLAAGKALKIELPFGDFCLRDAERPAILVASGTGFAPIKSMLEDAFRRGLRREFVLYWGARRLADLYQIELPQKWEAAHPNFRFVPVLSEPAPGDKWQGRTGFVHHAVMQDYASLAGCEVYACGVSAMINAAREGFLGQRQLPPDLFFSDAYVTPADLATTA